MTTTHLKSAFAIAALSIALVSTANADVCKAKHEFKTIKPGVLTVTSAVVPPFVIRGDDGQASGVDIEVVRTFAADNCLKLEHVFTDSAAAIQYVASGRSDLSVGAWYRTSARAKVLGISDPIYLEQTAIYSRDGATEFNQLKDRKVGTVQGYLWVPELKKLYGSNLSLYPTAVALAQDLSTGRIQAAVNTYSIGVETQRKGGMPADIQVKVASPDPAVESSIEPAQASYLFAKTNSELGVALNGTIKKIHENGDLVKWLKNVGLEASAAETGEARYAD